MVHLAIHLANEAKLGGPIQFRWMYYIERFLRTLKGYVHNKYRAERSIVEGRIADECMTLCYRYFTDMETKENRPDRNFSSSNIDHNGLSIFNCHGKSLAGGSWTNLSTFEINQAHFYILQNCEEVRPWIDEHFETLAKENSKNVAKRHKEEFPLWFEKKVLQLKESGDNRITEELLILARPPDHRVFCHSGYILNDFRFRTMEPELGLKTQNSGVVVKSDEHTGNVDYFGKPIKMTNMHLSNDSEAADATVIPPPENKRKGRGKTTGLSTQKKRKENENGKLKVIIPPDRTVAVGPGAKDFITELSVKVLHNARHDVKNWKEVPDLAKNRIVAYMLDTFQLPDIQHNRDTILLTAKNLYRYRCSRHHDHFKKFATKEESLRSIPTDVNEAEWKFLVEYFSSDEFKKMSERNKSNKAKQEVNHICGRKSFQAVSYEARDTSTGKEPNFQKLWEMTHRKSNGHWVTNASAEVNGKVKDAVAEKIKEVEEGTDVDPIINAAFVQIMGEKSKYILGQGSGIKPASRISRNEIQEQLQAQQKEAEEER